MKISALFALPLLALAGCSEPPKHQIVFTHQDTCKIIINDLQYGQANDTERACQKIVENGKLVAVTVNFLSETCNAYRYRFVAEHEQGLGAFAYKTEDNELNTGCNPIPQYANTNADWIVSEQAAE